MLYRRHCGILENGKDSDVLELTRMIADRIEGTPSKKVVATALHVSKFILTRAEWDVVRNLGHRSRPARPSSRQPTAVGWAAAITRKGTKILQRRSPQAHSNEAEPLLATLRNKGCAARGTGRAYSARQWSPRRRPHSIRRKERSTSHLCRRLETDSRSHADPSPHQ